MTFCFRLSFSPIVLSSVVEAEHALTDRHVLPMRSSVSVTSVRYIWLALL